ncbi:MAG: hypothetical protein QM715_09990 [Nibricoccus sp.]
MASLALKISTVTPSDKFSASGRGFIISMNSWLKKTNGGGCHGLATEATITVEISGATREEVMPLVDSYVLKLSQSVPNVQLVISDSHVQPLTPEQKGLADSFNMAPTKLTLKFFKTLAAGSFIASNLMQTRTTSIFAEIVEPQETRMDQWKRILACGAAQRTCHVFRSEEACRRWFEGLEP